MYSKIKQFLDMVPKDLTSANEIYNFARNRYKQIMGVFPDGIDNIAFKETKIMGSIGCKISSILRGESDIYICLSLPGKSCPKDWDFAAPEAILKASGGAITNLDNLELCYGKNSFEQGGIIIATNNRKTHGSICLEIKKIIEKYGIYPL